MFKDPEIGSLERNLLKLNLQLTLYLSAGLVPDKALKEIAKEWEGLDEPLERVMVYCRNQAEIRNMPMDSIMSEVAAEIKSRDFLRFTEIITENRMRGGDIAEKLERERALMQSSRLSYARSAAKKAETKLSFPMGLLLLVLMGICISPAVLTV